MRSLILGFFILLLTNSATAEIFDLGGEADKFKGTGDTVPPRCQIEVPRTASEPFHIKWSCYDNFSPAEDITTEFWLYRRDTEVGELVRSFLGFPAAVWIDESLLNVEEFTQGLPIQLRLVARDRAGIALITPLLTVKPPGFGTDLCSLVAITQPTVATGGTTGLPSLEVRVEGAEVETSVPMVGALQLQTSAPAAANPCEIQQLCGTTDLLEFSLDATITNNGAVTGTLMIGSGLTPVEVSGFLQSGSTARILSVSGATEIDSVPAQLNLSCSLM